MKSIPKSDNYEILKKEIKTGEKTLKNRLAIQPMEGCDGTYDGKIDLLTHRRYERFAKSGAGLIWFEAVAIANEGRANPRQLFLNENTLDSFKHEVEFIRETAVKSTGVEPVIIMQATHSGRYSKPDGTPKPMIALNKPPYEKENPLPKERIVSDDYLKSLEEAYAKSAKLAEKAGFDGVDIKCCHGYLMSELMGAFMREGNYGGSFENRTRLYFSAIENAKKVTSKDFMITSRINVYDGFAYPYGFGVTEESGDKIDLSEPKKVVKILTEKYGFSLLNVTIGNPYVNPHVNRPFNHGPYESPENPLDGVERMMNCVGEIQKSFPDLAVVGSGFSYLGENSIKLATGAVESGICSVAGFGRQSFAYPEFAKDILKKGELDKGKCCIACGKCSELMRAGTVAGCVIRDSSTYLPYYKKYCVK